MLLSATSDQLPSSYSITPRLLFSIIMRKNASVRNHSNNNIINNRNNEIHLRVRVVRLFLMRQQKYFLSFAPEKTYRAPFCTIQCSRFQSKECSTFIIHVRKIVPHMD
jgi:hypothetical protein